MKTLGLFIAILVFALTTNAQTVFESLWNSPSIQNRIEEGIEKNRKGDATIILKDKKGNLIKNAQIEITQVSHEFLFGSNIFMFEGFDNKSENQKYLDLFGNLFNYASLPFYWKDFEPELGKPRYSAESKFIYRRPPPDPIVEFCKSKGIVMKGHTLVWDIERWSIPSYWPENEDEMRRLTKNRINDLAKRYKDDIKYWDVVNEVMARNIHVKMPYDYALDAFKYSQDSFDEENVLILNETTDAFTNFKLEYSPFYLLVENLRSKGAKIDAVGLQFHFFSEDLHFEVLNGKRFQPDYIYMVLDQYEKLNLPLHITEITFPALPEGPEGERNQAKLTEKFYKLWFSHPAIEAITWWNINDGTAAPSTIGPDGKISPSEDRWLGGLFRRDFKPKDSYHVLNKLINEEWKTHLVLNSDGEKINFKGFYGQYEIKVKYGKKESIVKIDFRKKDTNVFEIEL